ncbi:MAG: shikimate dehydrogenase [Clostridia bacterium]|nr:shikimate dehydrogenase [Clostridia bacterium]
MEYGLIGERLGHSFSADIHRELGGYGYELREIAREALGGFMENADFKGINVTIPYKEAVIPYLHSIDGGAAAIGAVNTVVKRHGKLYGYNTDFMGMKALLERIGADPKGKKTLILGTGGTSKTAVAVVKAMGGTEIYRVSRSGAEGAVTYEQAYSEHSDSALIINTTPVGMYPKAEGYPIDVSAFTGLKWVADAVYNPLRTRLVQEAREQGAVAGGGLYMLVAQAVFASELFLDRSYAAGTVERIYEKLLSSKENIVLIGMPASGKSTVGALLAARLGRALVDTDALVVEHAGMDIPTIFEREGEASFRDRETEGVKEAGLMSGAVIATGGGAVLREENVSALKQNGRLYFLDRPLDMLMPTEDRPLSRSRETLERRYKERYGIYSSVADCRIDNSTTADAAVEMIEKEFFGR